MLLEKEHDHFGELNQDRQRIEQDLKQIQEKHSGKKEELEQQMRQSKSYSEMSEWKTSIFFQLWKHKRNVTFFNDVYFIWTRRKTKFEVKKRRSELNWNQGFLFCRRFVDDASRHWESWFWSDEIGSREKSSSKFVKKQKFDFSLNFCSGSFRWSIGATSRYTSRTDLDVRISTPSSK